MKRRFEMRQEKRARRWWHRREQRVKDRGYAVRYIALKQLCEFVMSGGFPAVSYLTRDIRAPLSAADMQDLSAGW